MPCAPLLGISRAEIEAFVAELGLHPIVDPTNADLAARRNRIRHELLPELRRAHPEIDRRLARLAEAAAGATRRVERLLARHYGTPTPGPSPGTSLERLRRAPRELRPFLLARLHRAAGAEYPPRAAAVAELERQLAADEGRIGVDCGDGWRWRATAGHLRAERHATAGTPTTPLFAYTLRVPGVVEIPEIAASVRLQRERTQPWMFRGSPTRAALALALAEGDAVEIRNRRPGDRLQPLGCDYERRLKEILIDDKVAPEERSKIPLVVHRGRIAWVPGVTIDERYRIRDEETVWTASIQSPARSKPGPR